MATRQALVLSGGGAKGDFQLGAIRALYDVGVLPRILVGTSVGAINAAKLAEGEDAGDLTRGLAGLERIWESLRLDEDMSVPAPWLNDPGLDQDVVAALLGTGDASAIGADAPVPPLPGDTSPGWLSYAWNGAGWLFNDGKKLAGDDAEGESPIPVVQLGTHPCAAGHLFGPCPGRSVGVGRWSVAAGRGVDGQRTPALRYRDRRPGRA